MTKSVEQAVKVPPAPWVLEETDDGHLIRMGSAITNPNQHQVQHVIDYDHGLTEDDGEQWEEAVAIVHRVAAAPAMYEALKELLDTVYFLKEQRDLERKVRAAIALAEARP